MPRRLAAAYFAGAVAAACQSLALWVLSRADVLGSLGVSLAPELAWPWLARGVARTERS